MNLKINLLSSFFVLLITCCSTPDSTTIIYLVRHAEKQLPHPDSMAMGDLKWEDPDLTAEGVARAARLADLLADKNISSIYSTRYQRNVKTIMPLATKLNLSPIIYEWKSWSEIIPELKNQKGTALVCGHGDILLPMIEALGAQKPQQQLADQEYDKLFKVTLNSNGSVVETILF